jgi:hypothetical protein
MHFELDHRTLHEIRKGVLYLQRVYCIFEGCTVSSEGVLYPKRLYCPTVPSKGALTCVKYAPLGPPSAPSSNPH